MENKEEYHDESKKNCSREFERRSNALRALRICVSDIECQFYERLKICVDLDCEINYPSKQQQWKDFME